MKRRLIWFGNKIKLPRHYTIPIFKNEALRKERQERVNKLDSNFVVINEVVKNKRHKPFWFWNAYETIFFLTFPGTSHLLVPGVTDRVEIGPCPAT